MNNEYMTGRDIRGNEYEMRRLTDKEEANLFAQRVDTRGHQKRMLLLRDHDGIALPDWCKDHAMYYGGLQYDAKPRHIIVDDEDYWLWHMEDAEEKHEEYYQCRSRYEPFDWEEENAFRFYIGPATNWGEDEMLEDI